MNLAGTQFPWIKNYSLFLSPVQIAETFVLVANDDKNLKNKNP